MKFFASISKITAVILVFISVNVKAQNNSFFPQNLGPNVNTEYPEVNPVLSEDGKTLFFNRQNHPENYYGKYDSQDIWFSYLQPDGNWSPAKRLDASFNKARNNAILCNLGKETYLIDGIYTKSKNPKWLKRGLSVVTKNDNDQWSAPEKIKIKGYTRLNEGKESNVWMTADKKVIVYSYSHHYNGKKNNIYVSLNKGGKWTKPKKVSKVINARHTNEEAPFISYDNEIMYFASNRGAKTKKDRKYNYHIYKVNRLDETWTQWSTPMPLNDTINSEEWESYFKTNPKGSIAYFASTKKAIGQSDLFKIKLFEENPFVEVTGFVMNKTTNQPLAAAKKYTIISNGKVIDSIWLNQDSSTYKIKLPLGQKYVIAADLKNYKSIPDTIDVTGKREFTQLKKDLYLEPMPYVLVSGNVMVVNPRGILPSSTSPNLTLDGKIIDSVKIRYPEGSYEIMLPYGKSYVLSVNARKFVGEPAKLDFSKIDEYQEIKKDLYVRSSPVATVTGHFYVKGTTNKIGSKFNPKLMINNEIIDTAIIDTAQSTYKIYLPLKKSYTLSFSSTKYKGITSVLDLTTVSEPKDVDKNLYGTYVNTSATVTGKVLNRKTNKPLLNAESVQIQSNGHEIAGSRYNPATGEYEAELALGSAYTINANLPKYFPQYEPVDLIKAKSNVKMIKDLYVTPLEVGQSVKLNNIFFESGKSTLKPKSFSELNKVSDFLTSNPNVKIQIEGHTDNVGKPDANLKLSKWRARAVQQYLVKKGIDIGRVNFDGYGPNKPIAKNTTKQGRSLNRRVEFKILSME